MTQQTLEPKSASPAGKPATSAPSQATNSEDATSLGVEIVRIIISLVIIAGGVFGAIGVVKSRKKPDVPKRVAASLPEVETARIVTHDGGLDIDVDGVVVPFKEIQLAAEVAGRIEFKSPQCRAGNFVKKGTELIRVDPRTYSLEVTRLKQQQEQAGQNLAELELETGNTDKLIATAESDLQLASAELARQRKLRADRVATQAAVDSAERAKNQAQNTLDNLKNQRSLLQKRQARLRTSQELAGTQLDRAKLDLERTVIKAPIDGVIVSEMAEADSFVQPGVALLTIEDTSAVEVRCNLTMEELYLLWQSGDESQRGEYDVPDAKVTVIYELAGREFAWTGRLARFDGLGLDQRTRTVPCRVVVPEPRKVLELHESKSISEAKGGPPALVRGMFVTARLHTEPDTKYLRVPQRAVRPGKEIWLVEPTDGKPGSQIKVAKAQVVGVSGSSLLIDGEASKIVPGDKAVVSPMVEVYDGLVVEEKAKP